MTVSINDLDNKKYSDLFNSRSEGRTYWVTKPTAPAEVPSDQISYDEFDPENKKIRILTPEQAKKTNNLTLIGLSIGGAVVATAGTVFFFLGGGPKGFTKKLDTLRRYLERQLQKSKLDNMNNPQYNWLYSGLIKLIEGGTKRFGVINNFNTFKDLLFKRFMHNRFTGKITGPMHDAVTKFFEWIGRRTVSARYKASYSSAMETRSLMRSLFKKISSGDMSDIIEVNGVSQTRKYWIAELKRLSAELEQGYDKAFGEQAIAGRYKDIKKLSQNVADYFEDKGHFWFWSKDTLNEFVAESAATKDKLRIQKQVKLLRRALYYSRKDLASESNDSIYNITRLVPINDTNKMRLLGNIRHNVKEFFRHGKSSAVYDALEERILRDVNSLLADIEKMPKGKRRTELIKEVSMLREQLSSYKRGTSQQILDIYRKLLPEEEYDKLYYSFRNSAKKLDSSIKAETEDFIDKVRDLTVGCAPTDILTMLSAFGTLGYYLKKSDSKEQKESVALKYGIPAIAGVITTLFCNAKMYAGSNSLIFGALSTVLVGKMGSIADLSLKEKHARIAQEKEQDDKKKDSSAA